MRWPPSAQWAIALSLALAVSVVSVAAASARPRPNVLFFAVDDLGAYLNSYGHPHLHTPNFDRLKAMGTQFNRAYVSVSVCAPSRTAFLTGLRPDTTRVWTIGPYFRNHTGMDGVKTLPQLFRDAGYNATGAGKIFHIGTPSGGMIGSEARRDSAEHCFRSNALPLDRRPGSSFLRSAPRFLDRVGATNARNSRTAAARWMRRPRSLAGPNRTGSATSS